MHSQLPDPAFPSRPAPVRPHVRILLLEDDASYAQLVCHHLNRMSWADPRVQVAGTLAEALEHLAAKSFDLVISDLNVPDSRGAATIAALAKVCKQPIIGITADDEPGLREHAVRGGAYEFLSKDGLSKLSLERPVRLAAMQAQALRSLRESEARFRDLYDNAPCGYHSLDPDGVFVQVNDTELKWLGFERGEVVGKMKFTDVVTPEGVALFNQTFGAFKAQGGVRDLEFQLRRKDGSLMWVLLSSSAMRDAQGKFIMSRSTVYDISERKAAEERIRYIAQHDALTGLPNRLLFQDRVSQAIAQAHRSGHLVAVLFIDLDHFKHINDSLGHQVGDRVLQAAAERLQRCLREGDSVCRLGGDEFVISLPSIAQSQDAAVVASKVLEALAEPVVIDGHELHIGGSIGISISPDDGLDATALMRAADTAMYHAKEKGRGHYRFFTAALNEAAQQRLAMASQLRQALARGEFALHYQPQVDLDTGKVFSVEALLRWQRPGEAPMSCAEFISVAEETGLILPLGEWALREACAQLRRWRASGHPDMQMAVNLSARQFYQSSFEDIVAQVLESSQLPASALELEITESLLLLPSQENLVTLERLAAMGVRLSIDDFGTGYSSLAYLQRFPIHSLKIDRSFVSGIGVDSRQTAIVTAIIAMAKSLRLKVVAEGVENTEQVAFLKSHGCLAAQGYFYARPMPAEAFEAYFVDPSGHALASAAAHA